MTRKIQTLNAISKKGLSRLPDSYVVGNDIADPDAVRPVVLAWAEADDLWLRRAAIISQLRAKDATDGASRGPVNLSV